MVGHDANVLQEMTVFGFLDPGLSAALRLNLDGFDCGCRIAPSATDPE